MIPSSTQHKSIDSLIRQSLLLFQTETILELMNQHQKQATVSHEMITGFVDVN